MATTNALATWFPGQDNSPFETRPPVMLVPGTQIKAWRFDPDTEMIIVLDGILDGLYGDTTGYTVKIQYVTPANATGAVRWGGAIKRLEDDVDQSDAGTYGTETIANFTVGSVAGEYDYATAVIAKANDDALAVGESFRLKIRREATNAGDTHTGPAYIRLIQMTET